MLSSTATAISRPKLFEATATILEQMSLGPKEALNLQIESSVTLSKLFGLTTPLRI